MTADLASTLAVSVAALIMAAGLARAKSGAPRRGFAILLAGFLGGISFVPAVVLRGGQGSLEWHGLLIDALTACVLPPLWMVTIAIVGVIPKRENSGPRIIAIVASGVGTSLLVAGDHLGWIGVGWLVSWVPLVSLMSPGVRRVGTIFLAASTLTLGAGLTTLYYASGEFLLSGLVPNAHMHPFALAMIATGVMIRLGLFPFQSWALMTFEDEFSLALPISLPMTSLVFVERLLSPALAVVLGDIPNVVAVWLVASGLFFGAMILVQQSLRRALGWFTLCIHSVVLFGVLDPDPVGHMGGIAMWLSAVISLAGFTIAVWALIARRGDVRLDRYSGLYARAPELAGLFLLFGLAAVGLPGTVDFVSEDLTLHGSVAHHPVVLVGLVSVVSLAGYGVLWMAFRVFLGPPVKMGIAPTLRRERVVLAVLALVLVSTGIFPQAIAGAVDGASHHRLPPVPARPMGDWPGETGALSRGLDSEQGERAD